MKILHFFTLFIFCLFLQTSLFAQTAKSNCTTVKTSAIPAYNNNVYMPGDLCGIAASAPCNVHVVASCGAKTPRFRLQRLDGNTWTSIGGWQDNGTFSNLAHDTYRVAVQIPEYIYDSNCATGKIEVFNFPNNQLIGYWGIYSSSYYTNSVVVGEVEQADVDWAFVDPNTNDLFNPDQAVQINTENTENYDRWWVAIFEENIGEGKDGYWSNGWTRGTVPNDIIDLSSLVGPIPFNPGAEANGFKAIPAATYTVQFAVMNGACLGDSWVNLDQGFAVCPNGLGCKLNEEQTPITLSPNPASDMFKINHLNIDNLGDYRIRLLNMRGQIISEIANINYSGEIAIDDVANGLYIVQVLKSNQLVQSLKLSVVK